MTQAERCSTVMHEWLYTGCGPVPMGLAGREELRVRRDTAQLLLPDVRPFADAMVWAQADGAAADELWSTSGSCGIGCDS